MTNKHTSLEKITSHTLFSKGSRKGCVWEVSWRRNINCNILIPTSSDYSSTSSSFFWAAQPSSWGPKPSVWRWLSLRLLISNNDWNSLPRTELCLPRTSTNSNCLWHRLYQMHLLFTRVHLLIESPVEGQHVTPGYIAKNTSRWRTAGDD